jgi:GNAT superfamily N-acetyltransferase
VAIIRLGVPADLPAASEVYRSASLSNAGDRDNLLAHPEYLVLGPEGLAEGRTYVAEEQGALVGFATWIEAGGIFELEDLFVDPGWRRRGIAAALVNRITQVLRARGVQRLEVTANPHAMGSTALPVSSTAALPHRLWHRAAHGARGPLTRPTDALGPPGGH